MPKAANEIVIERPLDEVFEFFADPERSATWRTGVLEIAHRSGSGRGARYAQVVQGPGGRRIPADIEITEWKPQEAVGFQTIAGPVRPRGRYTFAPADGGTRVRFELAVELSGLKRLMAPMVQKTMDSEVARLATAKSVLEQH
jgi:uncharacterized membrane protein